MNNDLKQKLTPQQYHVCVEKGTEPPFSGKYVHHHEDGMYTCAVCGTELFSSQTKFDSGSGWPSFWQAAREGAVKLQSDDSAGMHRTEVLCAKCGSHLGHVFDDGPQPSGERYCINSLSLDFKQDK